MGFTAIMRPAAVFSFGPLSDGVSLLRLGRGSMVFNVVMPVFFTSGFSFSFSLGIRSCNSSDAAVAVFPYPRVAECHALHTGRVWAVYRYRVLGGGGRCGRRRRRDM